MIKINRRQFIALSAASAGTAITAGLITQKNNFPLLSAKTEKNLPSLYQGRLLDSNHMAIMAGREGNIIVQ